jgi:hypothetical protein
MGYDCLFLYKKPFERSRCMPNLHETMLERKFLEWTVPELVQALKNLHKDCEILIQLKEDELGFRQRELALKERELNLLERASTKKSITVYKK